jgi:phosphoribosyl-ATP pyrophosphohydrolase/phosphoribosyl-AMP cyclohydrolase
MMNFQIEDLKFDERGLIPVVVQNAATNEALMLAYMNAESLRRTIETNETWFWSRSRQELWHKGETSGNTQRVVDIKLDCDQDALLMLVEPAGPACHTGARTCFHTRIEVEDLESEVRNKKDEAGKDRLGDFLDELYSLIESRHRERPKGAYTTQLFNHGLEKILAKVEEESQETVEAGREESDQRLIEETSDLLYHLLVLLVQRGVTLSEVRAELARRRARKSK